MTATLPAPAPTNGAAKTGGPRHRIEVDRHELVGLMLDLETLAHEAIVANGVAMRSVMRLLPGVIRHEAQVGLVDTHDRLVRLLNEARMAAGRFDLQPPTP